MKNSKSYEIKSHKNEEIKSYFVMTAFSLSADWSTCSSQQQQLFPIWLMSRDVWPFVSRASWRPESEASLLLFIQELIIKLVYNRLNLGGCLFVCVCPSEVFYFRQVEQKARDTKWTVRFPLFHIHCLFLSCVSLFLTSLSWIFVLCLCFFTLTQVKNPPNNLIFPTNVSEVNQNRRKVKA